MGFIPIIIAISSFLLLWALVVSNQLKTSKSNILALKKNLEELENYKLNNEREIKQQDAKLAYADLQQDLAKLNRILQAQIREYNRVRSKPSHRFLANLLGHKAL